MRRLHSVFTTAFGASLMAATPVMAQVYFSDSFTESIGQRWQPWDPDDGATCPGCGPFVPFNSDNHPHDGDGACARQEQAQPFWYGMVHDQPDLPQDGDIRLSGWMFEDFNKQTPFTIGQPGYQDHDQVQGWIALMDVDQIEFFAIGVHAHWNSPAPTLDWWQHLSWGTALDGWHTTTIQRQQGFRHLELLVHPYTGNVGDVEFFIDGQLVGQGRRQPGASACSGIPITTIGVGSNPNFVDEDYLSNTYEHFWYDEIQLSREGGGNTCGPIRFDTDADGDVDLTDFAAFQRCYTGGAAPIDCSAECRCMDVNGDLHVDALDLAGFDVCARRDRVASEPTCDDAP